MITADEKTIRRWFDFGIARRATHLVLAIDLSDVEVEEYPVFLTNVGPDDHESTPGQYEWTKRTRDVRKLLDEKYSGQNHLRYTEVFKLSEPVEIQLKHRGIRI